MASSKFFKLLQHYGFREFNPPFSSIEDTSNRRFFQKKIIDKMGVGDDVFLDVYIYEPSEFSNGNRFPGLIQFTSSVYLHNDQSVSTKITIDFDESGDIQTVIDLVIKFHIHNSNL